MKSEYIIQFSSLLDGKHSFHYKIGDSFFEQFEYSDIEDADLELDVSLEKKPNMMILVFDVVGSLKVMCDRCTESFYFPVSGQEEVIYKFSEEDIEDEKIICVLPNETGIDISVPVFEFASLLLPSRRIHPDGECNEEMLSEMDNYLMIESDNTEEEEESNDSDSTDENEIDPRWSQLKDLK